jgi:RNA polymerase sigma factor for flagellar operon FliA
MLDEIRRASWAPRSTVKVAVEARAAAVRIANDKGTTPTNRQIADALGLDVARYESLRGRNQGLSASVSLEDLDFASDGPLPEEVVAEESSHAALRAGILTLSEREQMIVALYYDRELTLKEIGAVLEVSESRVSQMLSAVARKLRETMGAGHTDTRNTRQNPKGLGGSDPRLTSRGRTTCS